MKSYNLSYQELILNKSYEHKEYFLSQDIEPWISDKLDKIALS